MCVCVCVCVCVYVCVCPLLLSLPASGFRFPLIVYLRQYTMRGSTTTGFWLQEDQACLKTVVCVWVSSQWGDDVSDLCELENTNADSLPTSVGQLIYSSFFIFINEIVPGWENISAGAPTGQFLSF